MSNYICHGFDKQRGESWEARLACYGWLVCVCACACVLVVRQSSNRSAAEWGHVWLQPLILPDAFGMMRLSAPGNPLNVFIQAACISHSHTHAHRRSASLVLKYFWLAEVVSSRSLFYFVSNFRVWGSCLALPSSPSFCSAFIKHSARAAVTRRRLLFIVTHPEAKFLLHFVHCHFRSSQS